MIFISLCLPLSRLIQQQQPPFHGHYTGQSGLAGISVLRTGGFVGAEFYCPHALADDNQRIRIRQKMPEFFSTELSTLSLIREPDISPTGHFPHRTIPLPIKSRRRTSPLPVIIP